MKYGKVLGKLNPADLFIKHLDQGTIEQHVAKLNYASAEGRACEAPKLHNVSMSIDEYQLLGQWRKWEWLDTITNTIEQKKYKGSKQERVNLCRGETNMCASINK